jgi:hypothetical protein
MNEAAQLSLIKEFMLVLAPIVARHRFTELRHNYFNLPKDHDGVQEYSNLAAENARITLELAMHLSGQYASCCDVIQDQAPDEVTIRECEPGPPVARVQPPSQDIPF